MLQFKYYNLFTNFKFMFNNNKFEGDMFSEGVNTEIEMLGMVNKKKERELLKSYISRDFIQREYPNRDPSMVRRLFANHPDEASKFDSKLENQLNYILKNKHKGANLNINDAKNMVREMQPNKRAGFADDLYFLLAERLGLEEMDNEDDFTQLKYYTAVHSKLDYVFKTDAFFTYSFINPKTNKEEKIDITIDFTTNPDKINTDVDCVLYFESEGRDTRMARRDLADEYAKTIAHLIKEKIKSRS